ncbi:MAG TPA: nucleoside recognition protein [Halanaerobiaceae bacterium]|nr:nucleoside recognition protein [Halanaerobiaceae bacterium]HOA41020.1 nucleoside recognition domain-containing protein [Halanaerobiales bacterium]HPZ63288.1 nucleoside recognition domain-containing protein [Halanaerobiales bacterium]HQD04539.1 nucleoside recognition domain-containing protein [Halanaerobiales bacterium]
MINILWFLFIVFSFLVAALNGRMEQISPAIFQAITDTVNLFLALIGPMAFWLGIMNIAKKSKLTDLIASLLRPIIKLIFPDIPENDPASGAIVMNITANILGLGNAATPLGIKAMQELQRLNNNSKKASFAMCTLLAINTAGLTLIPATIISLRAASGSEDPGIILFTTIFATLFSTITALIFDKFFRLISS